MTYTICGLNPLPPLELDLQDALTALATLDPSQVSARANLAELDFDGEVLLEVALFLFAERGHFLELDDGGSIYFRFLLLTQHECSVENVADNEILTNYAALF